MYWITQLFLFILCCLMFKVSREYKVAILLLSSICLDAVAFNFVPFGGSRYILSHCFILSEIPRVWQHIKTFKKTIIYALLLIVIMAVIVLIFNSPHYNNNLTNILRLFIMEVTGKYFAICYAFVSILTEHDSIEVLPDIIDLYRDIMDDAASFFPSKYEILSFLQRFLQPDPPNAFQPQE